MVSLAGTTVSLTVIYSHYVEVKLWYNDDDHVYIITKTLFQEETIFDKTSSNYHMFLNIEPTTTNEIN